MSTYIGDIIPGTMQKIQLSMVNGDLTRLITRGQGKLGKEYDNIIRAVFVKVQLIIFTRIGDTVKKPETDPRKITSNIIDRFPRSLVSFTKPKVISSVPFVDTIPLPGVASISIPPITDGKRCLPSLSVKKEGLN